MERNTQYSTYTYVSGFWKETLYKKMHYFVGAWQQDFGSKYCCP